MKRLFWSALPILAAAILLFPETAYAQVGSVAGVVRDNSQSVLPGVVVEVTSPALIEKVRSTTSDGNGRYQISALPVGTYEVSFALTGFGTVRRQGIVVSSNIAAAVNADLQVGTLKDDVTVVAESPLIDVLNAQQQHVISGAEIAGLPQTRDIQSVLNLVPGLQGSALRGACSGGVGGFCNPTVPMFNGHTAVNDTAGQNQGRIMVDGMSINMGRSGAGINENVGQANGIVLDTAGAQEVSFTLSGSLGESETGGTSINLVPRTGGNRFSGSYSTVYTQNSLWDRNRGTRLTWDPINGDRASLPRNNFVQDYDITGAVGGPVLKDRLWFYAQGRLQNRENYPGGQEFGFRNLNEGLFGANWLPDRSEGACDRVSKACGSNGAFTYINEYKNASARLTLQATQRNKFNIYWDEQDACTNPCYGMISVINAPEHYFTVQNRPNRLLQLSWTNPYTNKILLDAGITTVLTHQDQTRSREFLHPQSIPKICEAGTSVGRDSTASRMHATGGTNQNTPPNGVTVAGTCDAFSTHNSGSINSAFPSGAANPLNAMQNDDTYRSRASASYITGSHNMKLGFEGAYFMEKMRNEANDLRTEYNYRTPNIDPAVTTWTSATRVGNCLFAGPSDPYACGNMSLGIAQGWHDPNDPNNTSTLRPVPVGFSYNTGVATLDERVWFGALYLQDQWTVNRFTVNGALRFDHAESRYGESCVGPDRFVAEQWCSQATSGVRYNDLTPRFGVVWDAFGNGKTAVKFNGGKYLSAAGFGGNYTGFNDARRSVNNLTRQWDDINGNRVPDCDFSNHLSHTNLGDYCGGLTGFGTTNPSTNFTRFGRAPGADQLNNANSVCGLKNSPQIHVDYCQQAEQDLMRGWNTRRNEWQLGGGVQHEILPRISGEFTYNWRKYGNLTDVDVANMGCDYYGPRAASGLDAATCINGWSNYTDPGGIYDFFSFDVPEDPNLPGGGGYTIRGLTDERLSGALPNQGGNITLNRSEREYYWHGFDTNFNYRGPRGFRLSGGTSTGRAVQDTCGLLNTDVPDVRGRVGNERGGGCLSKEPWLTNVRANATYTIPFVDVLAGVVFSYRPGVQRTATLAVNSSWVNWEPDSAGRAGTLFNTATGTNATMNVNLLDNYDQMSEGTRLTDLTFRKNIRFAGKRLSAGVDVYNLFNSDAATVYQNTYQIWRDENGVFHPGQRGATVSDVNDWNRVSGIVNPRFVRFNVTFDF